MPASTIAVFSDPRTFEAAVQGACSLELLVTGKGQFRAEVINITLPRLRLLRGKERLSRIAAISVAPKSLLVILPIGQEQTQTCGGVRLGSGEIMTLTGGERLHLWTVGPCVWGIISISAREFISYGQAVFGRNFRIPSGVCHLQPSRRSLQSLMALFTGAMRLTEAQPSIPIQTDRTIIGLEQQVICVLLECMSRTMLQVNAAAYRQLGVMVRLDQLLQTYRCSIPLVSDICTALSISERTLQSCCRQHVGVNPSHYFHLLRMQRVFNALTDAHPETASVRQIAKCHGFKAPGRFAAAYRKQFGELPSTTLQRVGTWQTSN